MVSIKRIMMKQHFSVFRRYSFKTKCEFIAIVVLLMLILILFKYTKHQKTELVQYDKEIPLIWVGGIPRSGTTLMRSMLDAHESIRCGEETHIIPKILSQHGSILRSAGHFARLKEAGINRYVLLSAMASYILNIIELHGEPAPRLCNKDPFTISSISLIFEMFPKSKFIFMIRDGRATAHSIISRRVGIAGFDSKTYRSCITDWNKVIASMNTKCMNVTQVNCLPVHYEQLVLHPRQEMHRILEFLDVPWSDRVLHHDEYIGKSGGVSLSNKEPSTGQVKKPINLGALTGWVEFIPDDVRRDMRTIAPMLETLGYDPDAYPPHYGTPDDEVLANSEKLEKEKNQNDPTVQEKRKQEIEQKLRDNPEAMALLSGRGQKHIQSQEGAKNGKNKQKNGNVDNENMNDFTLPVDAKPQAAINEPTAVDNGNNRLNIEEDGDDDDDDDDDDGNDDSTSASDYNPEKE